MSLGGTSREIDGEVRRWSPSRNPEVALSPAKARPNPVTTVCEGFSVVRSTFYASGGPPERAPLGRRRVGVGLRRPLATARFEKTYD